jgi:membrane associated rhomboid family serine protease
VFVRIATRRRRIVPWVTITIAVVALGAFLVLLAVPDDERARMLARWGTIPAELFRGDGAGWQAVVLARPQTLLTSILMHADWLHLIGNVVFLLIFGLAAERALGSRRFLVLFLVCGLVANLSAAWSMDEVRAPIIGASGAVSGIVGAYLVLFPGARLGVVLPLGAFLEFVRMPAWALIGFWVLLQVIFSVVGPELGAVAWVAHLVGFVVGALLAVLWRPALARRARHA